MSELNFTSRVLLTQAAHGDRIAEEQLLIRYRTRLLALAAKQLPVELKSRVDADDVVQSACRVFIDRVRQGLVSVDQRGDLWDRLVAVTLNKIRSSVRKHQCSKRSVYREHSELTHAMLSREPTPEDACLLIEVFESLQAELPKLKQRQVLLLRLHGNSASEIAHATGYSVERVRQIIRWMRKVLESQIDSE
ncbi:MAG: sigma-70 family RNA polymerase sigma factor [Pirellulaceae bacterium]